MQLHLYACDPTSPASARLLKNTDQNHNSMGDCVDEDDNKGEEEEESDSEQVTDDDSRHDEPMALAVDVIIYISTCGMLHVMLLTTSCTTQRFWGVCIERKKTFRHLFWSNSLVSVKSSV